MGQSRQMERVADTSARPPIASIRRQGRIDDGQFQTLARQQIFQPRRSDKATSESDGGAKNPTRPGAHKEASGSRASWSSP
jgi:hypothetical protein